MDIPYNDDVERRQKFIPFIADPDHGTEEEQPGNSFGQADLFKPSDDFLFRIFCEKFFYNVHVDR